MFACGNAAANSTNENDESFRSTRAYPCNLWESNLMDGMLTPTARETTEATKKRNTTAACNAAIFVP